MKAIIFFSFTPINQNMQIPFSNINGQIDKTNVNPLSFSFSFIYSSIYLFYFVCICGPATACDPDTRSEAEAAVETCRGTASNHKAAPPANNWRRGVVVKEFCLVWKFLFVSPFRE